MIDTEIRAVTGVIGADVSGVDPSGPLDDATDTWHNDSTYAEAPPMGSVLRVVKAPSIGGDTCFANMYAAYDALSAAMQQHLDGLVAVHDIVPQLVIALERGHTNLDLDQARDQFPPMRHPVVRTHPETGRKALFVNSNRTTHIADVSRAESDSLLSLLYDHVKSPEPQCRFRWDERSLVFLDNRCLQHYAVPDYHERRVLHCVALKGDRPF